MCGGRLMNNLETTLYYSELLNLYGNLLSETQREMLEDYYCYDLSFSEIADNRHVTRSAVEDAIKKGKRKLDDYEKKLGSLKALNLIHKVKSETSDENITSQLDEVERIMKHGI